MGSCDRCDEYTLPSIWNLSSDWKFGEFNKHVTESHEDVSKYCSVPSFSSSISSTLKYSTTCGGKLFLLDAQPDTEKHVLLSQRLGHFDLTKQSRIYYCSEHEKLFSTEFKKKFVNKKICLMPELHSAKSKCKSGDPVTLGKSMEYLELLNYLVPVGSWVCNTCRKRASELLVQAKERKRIQAQLALAAPTAMEEEDTEPNKASQSQSQSQPQSSQGGSVYVQPSQASQSSQSTTTSGKVGNPGEKELPVTKRQKEAINELLTAFGYKVRIC